VLAEIDRLSRKRRAVRAGLLAAGVAAVGGLAFGAKTLWPRDAEGGAVIGLVADAAPTLAADAATVFASAPPDAAPEDAPDAATVVMSAPPDAAPRDPGPREGRDPVVLRADADAGPGPALGQRRVRLTTKVKSGVTFTVDGGTPQPFRFGVAEVALSPGPHAIVVEHAYCYPQTFRLSADDTREEIAVPLQFRDRMVKVECPGADNVTVDDKPLGADRTFVVAFGQGEVKRVNVEFLFPDRVDRKQINVAPGLETFEVTCDAP
jgi:hypothetical protein